MSIFRRTRQAKPIFLPTAALWTPLGNYTLPQLPVGVYSLTVESAGFRKFIQQGIRVQVAQNVRVDIALQVGSTTDSVVVTAEATLLKTENAEQSYNISAERMNDLPLNYQARGLSNGYNNVSGAIRNIFTFSFLAPGSNISGINDIVVNGAPINSFAVRVDGMDSNNSLNPGRADQIAPSVDAIQEISLQSSNFSAEYGQVAGGQFNFTTKSGTNQLHGAAYEYWINEVLSAGQTFTNDGTGLHIRPKNRQNDYGFTLGGPIAIPHIYNGRDKTFFFASLEIYRDKEVSSRYDTLPTDAMRAGDFSAILTGRSLGTDPAGRPMLENTIYDPLSAHIVNGLALTDPFTGNIVPQSKMDPVATKIQALFPHATRAGLVSNWLSVASHRTYNALPSIKIDHLMGVKQKLSFYYSVYGSNFAIGYEDLPIPLTADRDLHVRSHTLRINYDYTITPTILAPFLAPDMCIITIPTSPSPAF
jgi:Carboxypeptidase regulatory-like domain